VIFNRRGSRFWNTDSKKFGKPLIFLDLKETADVFYRKIKAAKNARGIWRKLFEKRV